MSEGDILQALEFIDPDCSYEEWLSVGMALHEEGHSLEDWERWSQGGAKYKKGDCSKRWSSFGHSFGSPVTAATIFKLAYERGYSTRTEIKGRALEWDDVLEADEAMTFRSDYNPADDFRRYLNAIFQPNDIVGYIVESKQKEEGGKWIPANKGCYDRTVNELHHLLDKYPTDLGAVIGDWNKTAGAWIRFNPLDGNGVNNANVTAYRFALVESDDMPIEQQNKLYRELNLPIAALVHSGGKSLHAIVHIDAKDYTEYQKRVNKLYQYLEDNGLTIDKANRNPSRLSRLPGVDRNGIYQRLVDTNIGAKNWLEWEDWLEGIIDETPDFELFSQADIDEEIPLQPVVIEGILKRGNVMLLTGASKAGKSTTLMELAGALALGEKWIGMQCEKSKVLYCNMELDPNECKQRIKEIYLRKHWRDNNHLFLWHLRGKAFNDPQKFADRLLRKANAEHFDVVIVDPIYKLNAGDENDASKMAQMFVQFDRIASELESTVIISHHHSKGSQSEKSSMDRASGSGVFARSPDAIIDMMELHVDEWRREKLLEAYGELGVTEKSIKANGAWQFQFTTRYFARPEPKNLVFSYPIHIEDYDYILEGAKFADEVRESTPKEDKAKEIDIAYEAVKRNGEVMWGDMADYLGISRDTLKVKACKVCRYPTGEYKDGKEVTKPVYSFHDSGIVEKHK